MSSRSTSLLLVIASELTTISFLSVIEHLRKSPSIYARDGLSSNKILSSVSKQSTNFHKDDYNQIFSKQDNYFLISMNKPN